MTTARDALGREVAALIDRLGGGASDDGARDALIDRVARYQRERVEPYGRLCAQRDLARAATLGATEGWPPALPTDVFRYVRVASHDAARDVRVFRTSGTTAQADPARARGAHPFCDLALYDRAARAWARHLLFPDRERMALVMLAPPERDTPDSSLSYMLTRFEAWFERDARRGSAWVVGEHGLDLDSLTAGLEAATRRGEPVALLGTSFAFVHALEGLRDRRFALPEGSRVMQTGGFKGRARAVAPDAMRRALTAAFGVPDPFIVAEYGMTELSSQLYESTLRDALFAAEVGPRRLLAPGWVRATPVDPESLGPVEAGTPGILRIDDLANLDSVCAVQTSDLARSVQAEGTGARAGVEVLGRAPDAVPRGCSIAADLALGEHLRVATPPRRAS
ncbi:MAG: acyl-protein synthetase [Myxococcales bacterium]|nr:acyl-protein synthetase [Myxococcales bacterium]